MPPTACPHKRTSRSLFAALAIVIALVVGLSATAFASDWDHHNGPTSSGPSPRWDTGDNNQQGTTNSPWQGDRNNGPKPTIVLVHGAWADASSWSQVIENLQEQGYPVIAPPNPLRGIASDSAYLQSILSTISGPIVLVGHSYGGAVITNAAVGNPNVKALVYIAAFAPAQGETLSQIEAMNPGSAIGPSTLTIRPYPLAGGGGSAGAYITPSAFQNVFAADLPSSQAAEMAAAQRPIDVSALNEPSGVPAWKTIPSWYLVARQDNAIPAATELFMAQRMHAHTIEINSSHVAMISHPDVVTRLIDSAAASVG